MCARKLICIRIKLVITWWNNGGLLLTHTVAESIKQIVSMYCASFTLDYVSVQIQVYSHMPHE